VLHKSLALVHEETVHLRPRTGFDGFDSGFRYPWIGYSSQSRTELARKGEEVTEGDINRGWQAPDDARQWLSQMQALSEQILQQQQNFQQMIQELMNTYMQLLNTPGSYASGQAEQQQQTLQQTVQQWMEQAQQQQQMFQQQAQQQQQAFQQMAQESMNTFMQMFNIPHSYLQEGMRLAQKDAPGSPQERSTGRDPKEEQYRRSTGQSS
jgi:signal transduction histidine kinase